MADFEEQLSLSSRFRALLQNHALGGADLSAYTTDANSPLAIDAKNAQSQLLVFLSTPGPGGSGQPFEVQIPDAAGIPAIGSVINYSANKLRLRYMGTNQTVDLMPIESAQLVFLKSLNTFSNFVKAGWQNLSLQNGWAQITGKKAQYRIEGCRISIRLAVDSGTAGVIATLPLVYRPSYEIHVPVAVYDNGGNAVPGTLTIGTDGVMTLQQPTVLTGVSVYGNFVFYTD